MSSPNVEWYEQNFPVLYLFRRHVKDGAGAGKYRGGRGAETAHMLHDAPEGKIKGVTYGVAGLRNSGQGIFGGYPGAPSVTVLLEDTRVKDLFAENKCVEDLTEVGGNSKSLPYCEFDLKKNDIFYMRLASGGGYGDPLERAPESVFDDFNNGVISRDAVQEIYGVVLDKHDQEIDLAATERVRSALREARRG